MSPERLGHHDQQVLWPDAFKVSIITLSHCAMRRVDVGVERKPLPSYRSGSVAGSVLAGRVLYAVNGFFPSVLSVPRCSVGRTFYLVNLAFGFKFLVANDVPSSF